MTFLKARAKQAEQVPEVEQRHPLKGLRRGVLSAVAVASIALPISGCGYEHGSQRPGSTSLSYLNHKPAERVKETIRDQLDAHREHRSDSKIHNHDAQAQVKGNSIFDKIGSFFSDIWPYLKYPLEAAGFVLLVAGGVYVSFAAMAVVGGAISLPFILLKKAFNSTGHKGRRETEEEELQRLLEMSERDPGLRELYVKRAKEIERKREAQRQEADRRAADERARSGGEPNPERMRRLEAEKAREEEMKRRYPDPSSGGGPIA